jgi:LacI family transcriptional regulator
MIGARLNRGFAMAKHSSSGRARIQDVAALAGVSPATASRALADDPKVTPATRQKVLEAAGTLRFRRNSLARDLRSGGVTTAIGYVIEDLMNPWHAQVAAGAEKVFREKNLELIVATTGGDARSEQLVVKTMLERRVQALLMILLSDDHSYLEGERQLGTPLIFVDRPPVNLMADCITIDNRNGMRLAVENLWKAGHRTIGVIAGPESLWTTSERIEGYRQGIESLGGRFDHKLVRHARYSAELIGTAFIDLMTAHPTMTAVISTNNRITVTLLNSHKSDIDRMGFIGFDDFELAGLLKISVVSHNPLDVGREAARITLERIANPLASPQRIEVSTEIVERGSGERPPERMDR